MKGNANVSDTRNVNHDYTIDHYSEPATRCHVEEPGGAVYVLVAIEVLLKVCLASMSS